MNNNRNSDRVFINHMIRAPKVLCIDSENRNLGVINTQDAIRLAQDDGLDLVQMAPPVKDKPPTCKIMNYGKFKYDQTKSQKVAAKKQRETAIKIKEIKFRPNTDINDLQTKAKKAVEFIAEGSKIKVTIMFRTLEISNHGRENFAKSHALDTLTDFLAMVPNIQLAGEPSMEGKFLSVMLEKKP